MGNIPYKKGNEHRGDMAVYLRSISEDNGVDVARLKRNLMRAMEDEVTVKQKRALLLYYERGKKMQEIARELGVDISTISRNIKRGEARLRKCLMYGMK